MSTYTFTANDAVIVSRALQVLGTRTTVTAAELNNQTTNEAIQTALIYTAYRDQLLRMAPWNCAVGYVNLTYLTSTPGTPENTSPYTPQWQPGQPPLGWAYEYLYPDDCLRACFVIPSLITGFSGGVPIYPIPTSLGTAPTLYNGPAIKFKVQLEQYLRSVGNSWGFGATGSGYQVGDTVLCGGPPSIQGAVPAGLINFSITSVGAGGAVTGVQPTTFPNLDQTSLLFSVPTYPLSQVSTSGFGSGMTGAVGNLSTGFVSARVILTNQEFATLAYVKQIADTTLMDSDFVEAWVSVLGGGLAMALTADSALANRSISLANAKIMEARKVDGNEGLTVNDVTPDFVRIRGIDFPPFQGGMWNGFDWGTNWPLF